MSCIDPCRARLDFLRVNLSTISHHQQLRSSDIFTKPFPPININHFFPLFPFYITCHPRAIHVFLFCPSMIRYPSNNSSSEASLAPFTSMTFFPLCLFHRLLPSSPCYRHVQACQTRSFWGHFPCGGKILHRSPAKWADFPRPERYI